MENQHRKITGYRELDETEIALMNEIKALGPVIEGVLLKVDAHLKTQEPSQARDNATPERFLAMAKSEMQTGLMYATRAVAQPEFF